MDPGAPPGTRINTLNARSTNPHRCWAEINLAAFERNVKRIRAELPERVRYLAVVKADAYGHGMPQMVQRLMQCGVDYFGVANVHEAADIRHMGAGWPILVLSPVLPNEMPQIIDYDLIATVSTLEEAERFNKLADSKGLKLKVHLKIDTGMGRLGVWHSDAFSLIERIVVLPHLKLDGIYTHFSSADTDSEFTQLQRRRFLKVLDAIKHSNCVDLSELLIHADNSSSLSSLRAGAYFNAVRVGLLQLGIQPYADSILSRVPVEPVFSFYTKVGLIKELPAGTDISYSRTHTLKEKSRIAVLTAGYGDGIPLMLSNRGHVLIRGTECPILGRVTMDQTMVDITDLDQVEIGDTAVLIGKQGDLEISAKDFSDTAESIPWETLCSITKRVTRVYAAPREL